jgi:bifunctional non-homologous end joining protein LigD
LFVIGGFTDQQGSRGGLGALLVGRYDGRKLIYNGRVGTGFTQALALELRKRLESIEQRTCPFDPAPTGPVGRAAHWVKPALVCEATFTETTAAGMLRAPSFRGLRPDAKPKDVVNAT